MLVKVRQLAAWICALAIVLSLVPYSAARADATCTITISPDSVAPGSEVSLQYDIANTGSQPITWISVQRPTGSYSINGISIDGFTDATNDSGTTLTGGSVAPGNTFSFQLAMQTAPQEEPASSWTIQAATSGDGSGAASCTGSDQTTIATPATPPTPNGESGIGLTAVAPTTATISWTSDTPSTSYVYYGLDDGYGKIASTPGSDALHAVTLTGLTPNTVYHYKVAGSDDQGSNYFSGDNTFVTPAPPPPPLQPIIIINNPAASSGSSGTTTATPVIAAVPGDNTPPTVTLDTTLGHPFRTAPAFRGSATDNGALARFEYSTDAGRNWQVIAHTTGLGTGAASFSFTPVIQDDGNYTILVRAIDSNGNQAATAPVTLVIDRLPPQLGPLVVSYGPEVLAPDGQGMVDLVAGSSYRLAVSGVGGPTTVQIAAHPIGAKASADITFSLAQSADTGRWGGTLSFTAGGTYQLTARLIDGAGNRTTRQLLTVAVSPSGQVLDAASKSPLAGARLTLHYLEPSTQSWQVWNGAPYGQTNPQTTKPTGTYSLMVPEGQYYLQVQAPGHHTYTSDTFRAQHPTSLAAIISLTTRPQFKLAGHTIAAPELPWTSRPLLVAAFKSTTATNPLIGTMLPDFTLPTIAGGSQSALDLEGKPTVLTVLTTWSPDSQSQLAPLAAAQTNHDVNIVPVFSQEHPQLVATYLDTADLTLTGLVDPDGTLVPSLQTSSLPQHIFVDRSGHIKKVMLGVLSKDELLNQLGGL